ncbi:MAG TPA: TolC family protein [Acidisoma sp.]|nr:TolC family protein [Acidisoma sp.]
MEARSLQDPGLLKFIRTDLRRTSVPMRWDLDALITAAVYERPNMKIAAAEVRMAQGGERTAAEWPNPVLAIAPTYNTTAVLPSPWKVGPVITELLKTAGKRPAAMAEARARTAATRQELAVAAWQMRSQVRQALIGLWAARQRAALARSYFATAREMGSLAAERFRAGMVSAATLTQERLTATQAALDLASAERQQRLAQAALAAAVGVPEQAITNIDIDMAGIDRIEVPTGLHALSETALSRRPDVLATLAQYDAAQAALRLAVANQYPDLNIGPGYHYDQGDNKFILDVSLPLPVFNQNQGPIATARARRQLAAARFAQVQTQVLGQIGTAIADWQASRQEAANTRSLLALAEQAVRSDRMSFHAGAIGRLRLAGAELSRAQTELGALAARVDERTALGKLEDAFHHPFIDAGHT